MLLVVSQKWYFLFKDCHVNFDGSRQPTWWQQFTSKNGKIIFAYKIVSSRWTNSFQGRSWDGVEAQQSKKSKKKKTLKMFLTRLSRCFKVRRGAALRNKNKMHLPKCYFWGKTFFVIYIPGKFSVGHWVILPLLGLHIVKYNFLPMTGFKLRTSGVGSDHSTDWAKTTVQFRFSLFEFNSNGWKCSKDESDGFKPLTSGFRSNISTNCANAIVHE